MSLLVKMLLGLISLLGVDLLIVGVASSGGVVSVSVVVIILVLTGVAGVALLLKYILLPVQKLYDAVNLIDFDSNVIDFCMLILHSVSLLNLLISYNIL